MQNTTPQWLQWARQIQALSQSGIAYSKDEYDIQRYRQLMEIAADIVQQHTGLSRASLMEAFSLQSGYATPKIDVRGAVVREGKILLVQERSDGRWCLPGGWADVGESPAQMVAREVLEESGFQVNARKLIAVYDANRDNSTPPEFFHTYKLIFCCQIVSGEAKAGLETKAVDFFDFDDLPPLSVIRTSQKHLKEVYAHLQDFHRPTAFD